MVTLNSAIDFLALGVALWLGLYIIVRSRSRLAWLAAGTLWSLVGYFLNRVVNLNFLEPGSATMIGGWSAALGSPLWYHLSTEFRRDAPYRRVLVPLGYGLSIVFLGLLTRTDLLFGGRGQLPALSTGDAQVGVLYPVYALFLFGWPLLSLLNFHTARGRAPIAVRTQVDAMWRATLVGMVGVAYLVVGELMRVRLPIVVGDVALGVAVALLGYAVARYNAIFQGRAANTDLPYTSAAIGIVALVYLAVTWLSYRLYNIPLAAFVLVFMLAIASHTLYDGFRSQLDRFFYRRTAARLRESLRALAREAGGADALDRALRETLVAACASLGADRGLVALRSPSGLTIAASLRAGAPGHVLADFDIPDDAVPLSPAASELREMAVIAPLVWAGETLGFIAMGPRVGGYSDGDLAAIADVADRIAGVVYAARAAEVASAELNAEVEKFRAREQDLQRQVQALTTPAPAGVSEAGMTRLVEDGLRHLHDFPYLGEHRLARLKSVDAALAQSNDGVVTVLERGQALRDVLVRSVERLRPSGPEPKGDAAAGRREWHAYLILRESYIEGTPTRDTMNRLYMSEGTYNRTRRQALRGVARAINDEESETGEEAEAGLTP